jgi:hypothetical protein
MCVCFVEVVFAARLFRMSLKMFSSNAVRSRPVMPEDKMPSLSDLMVEFG